MSQKIHAFISIKKLEELESFDKNQPQTFVYSSELPKKMEVKYALNTDLIFFMKEEYRSDYGYVPVSISLQEISVEMQNKLK